MGIYDKAPVPIDETYIDDCGDEVELIWCNVAYTDDEGFSTPLIIYLDNTGTICAMDQNLWRGVYKKAPNPNESFDYYKEGK